MNTAKERFYRYWLLDKVREIEPYLNTLSDAKDFLTYFMDEVCPSDTVVQSWLDDFNNNRK